MAGETLHDINAQKRFKQQYLIKSFNASFKKNIILRSVSNLINLKNIKFLHLLSLFT